MKFQETLLSLTGQEPSGHDCFERARGSVFVRGPWLAAHRVTEPGDAAEGLQLPLPRAQARCHRGKRRLY